MFAMPRVAALVLAALALARAETPPATLENTDRPMRVPLECKVDQLQSLGLSCTEDDPCPLYLELDAVDSAGERILVAGNIHGSAATVSTILLASADGGKTWTEPFERIPSSELEQIQFFDADHGWISGSVIQTLPRDPFFLLTTDGGKTWEKHNVLEDTHQGSIDHFHFESPQSGELALTPVDGKYELYETMTGGQNWTVRQISSKPLTAAQPVADKAWRLRTDAKTHSYVIEHREGNGWQRIASFLVELGACK